jgi:glycine/D-amino acid oxidase-like deaminating enzyme
MTDIIVIGGGIAGVSAAARLSHLGKVMLLERETALGYHASGRSAALYEQNYGKPSVIALNRASLDYLSTANGGVISPRGIMLVGSRVTADLFEHDLVAMHIPQIDIRTALQLWPILNPAVVDRAAYDADAWDIDTDRLIQNFAREIRGNGGQVLTGAGVSGISRTRDGWTVRTAQGDHSARLLVNASGAWADEVANMAGIAPLGFTPLRRSMARIPAPGERDVSRWPMIFNAGEDWYAKPDAGALIVSPAEEHLMQPHDAFADDMVLAEGLARYEAHMTEPVTRLLSNWAGLRTFSPDRQLALGRDKRDAAFFWCAGQGGYGFQTSPAASQLVADLVAGRSPQLDGDTVAAVDPARFD